MLCKIYRLLEGRKCWIIYSDEIERRLHTVEVLHRSCRWPWRRVQGSSFGVVQLRNTDEMKHGTRELRRGSKDLWSEPCSAAGSITYNEVLHVRRARDRGCAVVGDEGDTESRDARTDADWRRLGFSRIRCNSNYGVVPCRVEQRRSLLRGRRRPRSIRPANQNGERGPEEGGRPS